MSLDPSKRAGMPSSPRTRQEEHLRKARRYRKFAHATTQGSAAYLRLSEGCLLLLAIVAPLGLEGPKSYETVACAGEGGCRRR